MKRTSWLSVMAGVVLAILSLSAGVRSSQATEIRWKRATFLWDSTGSSIYKTIADASSADTARTKILPLPGVAWDYVQSVATSAQGWARVFFVSQGTNTTTDSITYLPEFCIDGTCGYQGTKPTASAYNSAVPQGSSAGKLFVGWMQFLSVTNLGDNSSMVPDGIRLRVWGDATASSKLSKTKIVIIYPVAKGAE